MTRGIKKKLDVHTKKTKQNQDIAQHIRKKMLCNCMIVRLQQLLGFSEYVWSRFFQLQHDIILPFHDFGKILHSSLFFWMLLLSFSYNMTLPLNVVKNILHFLSFLFCF